MSGRKLKFHEKKLLKKVDFFNWKNDNNIHEVKVVRRYHLQDREDYTRYTKNPLDNKIINFERYNKICGIVTSLISKIKLLK